MGLAPDNEGRRDGDAGEKAARLRHEARRHSPSAGQDAAPNLPRSGGERKDRDRNDGRPCIRIANEDGRDVLARQALRHQEQQRRGDPDDQRRAVYCRKLFLIGCCCRLPDKPILSAAHRQQVEHGCQLNELGELTIFAHRQVTGTELEHQDRGKRS